MIISHNMPKKKELFYIICDNIRSAYNVGSIFRTSDALGADKIYLCGITPTPKDEKIAKTALGAEKTVPWEYHWQSWRIIDKLKKEKFQIAALEQEKESAELKNFKPKFPLALVVGNEVKGVSKSALEKSDKIIEISMKGKKESLNVSVAFGIAAWEISKYK